MPPGLRIIRSMYLDFACHSPSIPSFPSRSTPGSAGCPGAKRRTPAFRGPTPRHYASFNSGLALVSALLTGAARAAPSTIEVRRDGAVHVVHASAVVQPASRVAWETLTDYERLRESVPDIKASRALAPGTSGIAEAMFGQSFVSRWLRTRFEAMLAEIARRQRLATEQR
jgi:hypothetical protein